MRTIFLAFVFLILHADLFGQETRTEVTSPANGSDPRPNNASVPDGYSIPAEFERVLILRFKYQTDLLDGLDSLIVKEKIRNAVILAGIGSVRNYRYHVVNNRTFPSKDVFISNPTAPADIVSMNGYVIDGRVHAHITFSDNERAFGGHLEKGTNVFTFAIVTVGVLGDDVDIKHVDDRTYR